MTNGTKRGAGNNPRTPPDAPEARMDRYEAAIKLLEELLALTARFKDQMDPADCDSWQRISAETADLREGE